LTDRNKTPRTSSSPPSSGNEHIVDEKEDNNTPELRSAQEAEAIGHDDEALVLYLLAGDLRRVCAVNSVSFTLALSLAPQMFFLF
jgi:hypothetical protein